MFAGTKDDSDDLKGILGEFGDDNTLCSFFDVIGGVKLPLPTMGWDLFNSLSSFDETLKVLNNFLLNADFPFFLGDGLAPFFVGDSIFGGLSWFVTGSFVSFVTRWIFPVEVALIGFFGTLGLLGIAGGFCGTAGGFWGTIGFAGVGGGVPF